MTPLINSCQVEIELVKFPLKHWRATVDDADLEGAMILLDLRQLPPQVQKYNLGILLLSA